MRGRSTPLAEMREEPVPPGGAVVHGGVSDALVILFLDIGSDDRGRQWADGAGHRVSYVLARRGAMDTGVMRMITVPPGCAAGEIEITSMPEFTLYCRQDGGHATVVAGITVTPTASTADPSPGIARAAAGVDCRPTNPVGQIGVTIGPGGIQAPIMFTDPNETQKQVSAPSPINYEYACRSDVRVLVHGEAGVASSADHGVFSTSVAFGIAHLSNGKVNTETEWNLVECASGESHSGSLRWD